MKENVSDYATPASAIRVFVGFRHPDLSIDRFQLALGQTFMPGTPYMLQPLGLAAYAPAVFAEVSGRILPHEVALIVWPSQPAQQRATRDTLRGRVYTQSHGGVYTATSRATFPIDAAKFDVRMSGAFYLFDVETDWQRGDYGVFAGIKRDTTMDPTVFRRNARDAIMSSRSSLQSRGVDQCIASVQDNFLIIWTHVTEDGNQLPFEWSLLDDLVSTDENLTGTRIVCRTDPPNVPIVGSAAFNFIFQRDSSYFIR